MKSLSLVLFALFGLMLMPHTSAAVDNRIVIRVISGDTIVVDGGEVVRLLGVLAPVGEETFAKQVQEFVAAQLLGREVELETDSGNMVNGHRDKYGRKLAYVFRYSDKFFINLALVREGYAYVSTQHPFKRNPQFQTEQLEARRTHRGLWNKEEKTPQERAQAVFLTYEEPPFEPKPDYQIPDIRVEIVWAKRADPRYRTTRTAEEAKFIGLLYQDDQVSAGKLPPLVSLRQNFAKALTEFYQGQGVQLRVETTGNDHIVLRFIAAGMDQSDADKFCEQSINRELFSKLEFTEVIFTDDDKFRFTYKVIP
ncbi:MAG: thermonuclease family protein [Acidobacteriota bacterium]